MAAARETVFVSLKASELSRQVVTDRISSHGGRAGLQGEHRVLRQWVRSGGSRAGTSIWGEVVFQMELERWIGTGRVGLEAVMLGMMGR